MIAFGLENGKNGRDARGRFAKGNRCGPGRARKLPRELQLRIEESERLSEVARVAARQLAPGYRQLCDDAADIAREVADELEQVK